MNALGEPTAYEVEAGDTAVPQQRSDFPALQRAPFAQHPFWVTQYRGDELYAGGDYPNQGRAGQGLSAYSNSESVDGKDVVVWYTLALTLFYSLAPLILRMASAAFFDVSLLTGNFWGVIRAQGQDEAPDEGEDEARDGHHP